MSEGIRQTMQEPPLPATVPSQPPVRLAGSLQPAGGQCCVSPSGACLPCNTDRCACLSLHQQASTQLAAKLEFQQRLLPAAWACH